MAKRRTPPLFEVLGVPDRRSSSVGSPMRRAPVVVSPPPPTPPRRDTSGTTNSGPSGGAQAGTVRDGQLRITTPTLLIIIAAVLLVLFGVLYLAYGWGQKDAQVDRTREIEQTFPNAPGTGGSGGLTDPQASVPSASPSAASGPKTVEPAPSVSAPANDPLTDPRQVGYNYLIIETLPFKDAVRAAEYLTKSGVPSAVVPASLGKSPVDVQTARDKNLPHWVIATEGIPPGQWQASKAATTKLVDQVRQIGKKWHSEERGPSDLGASYWKKYEP